MKHLYLLLIICLPFVSAAQIPWELWSGTSLTPQDTMTATLFHMPTDGPGFSVDHYFKRYRDKTPYGALIETTPGICLGVTSAGGIHNGGIIFRYEFATNDYHPIFQFQSTTTGKNPLGSLILANDGKVYGMTSRGGTTNRGAIFRFDVASGAFEKIHDFDSLLTGCNPKGSLIQASNGKMYGMTYNGGVNNKGVLFELDPLSGTVTKLLDFDGAATGANPSGDLMEANNGKLYGLTRNGGSGNYGVLFELDPATSLYTKKLDISAANRYPLASLRQAPNDLLYATNYGTSISGSIFSYNISTNTITTVQACNSTMGYQPAGNVCITPAGTLLCCTTLGGAQSRGTLAEVNPSGGYQVRYVFQNGSPGILTANGSLLRCSDGNYYGLASEGGYTWGGLYVYNGTTVSVKVSMYYRCDSDGTVSSFTYCNENEFYALGYGGSNAQGSVLRYIQDVGKFEVMCNIVAPTQLTHPVGEASFTEHADGNYYAAIPNDNAGIHSGFILKYTPGATSCSVVFEFLNAITQGRDPKGRMVAATDGKLYGLTQSGGSALSRGTIYSFDPATNTFTQLYVFDETTGKFPQASLIQASNGILYGMASAGGTYNKGVIFSFNPTTAVYTLLHSFDGTDGLTPLSSFIEATDGKLYAPVRYGGSNNAGVLIAYDILTNSVAVVHHFSTVSGGSQPMREIMQARNGKIYGTTSQQRRFFEFDPVTGILSTKYVPDAATEAGNFIRGGAPIEVCQAILPMELPEDTILCMGIPFSLTLQTEGSNLSFEWYKNGVMDSAFTSNVYSIADPQLSDSMDIYCKITNGCRTRYSDTMHISVAPPPVVYAGEDQVICADSSIVLYGSGEAVNYTWDQGVVDSVAFFPSATNTFIVTGISEYGCINTDTVIVTVPVITLLTNGPLTVCVGDSALFFASGTQATYTWDNGIEDSVAFEALATDMYIVTATDTNGCIALDTTYLNVNSLPIIDAGGPYDVCSGSSLVLSGTGDPAGYSWNNGISDGIPFIPLSSGTYVVVATDLNGCSNTDSAIVSVHALPVVDAGSDTSVCETMLIAFSADGDPAVYSWNNGIFNGVSFSAATTGNYVVTATDANSCIATDTVFLTVYPLPAVEAGGPFDVCTGSSLLLSATGDPATYLWNNGIDDGVSFIPTASDTFVVIATDLNGCSASDSAIVSIHTFPVVDAGPDMTICENTPIILTAAGDPATYAWSNGVTDGVSFILTLAGAYIVTASDANGCSGTDTVLIVLNTLPAVDAGADMVICENTPIMLSASGDPAVYLWNNGVTDGLSFTPVASDTFIVMASDLNGCSNVDTVLVTVNSLPAVDAGTDVSICENASVVLQATGDPATYQWNNGITDGVSFTAISDTYVVIATTDDGCTATDSMVLTVNPLPVISAGPDQHICALTSTTLQAIGGISYNWNNGVTDGETFIPAMTQTYIVSSISPEGCSGTDSVVIYLDNCSHVWPGDTDNDGNVASADFLNLGLNYGASGIARSSVSNAWLGHYADWWADEILLGSGVGKNMNFNDCDGSGSVDLNDTLAIYQNYSLTHDFQRPAEAGYVKTDGNLFFTSAYAVYGANTPVAIDIHAGNAANPIEDLYALAFDLQISSPAIVPGSFEVVLYEQSWIGTQSTDAIRLNIQEADLLHLGISRIDHANVTGHGIIGQIHFVTSEISDTVNVEVYQPVGINSQGIADTLTIQSFSVIVDSQLSLSETAQSQLVLYPNPTNGSFTISGLEEGTNYVITINDVLGNEVHKQLNYLGSSYTYDKTLIPGTYFITLRNDDSLTKIPLTVVR